MIPLPSVTPPTNHAEFMAALTRGLAQAFEGRVGVAAEGVFPHLQSLTIDVTNAHARREFRTRPPGGRTVGVVTAGSLRMLGKPLIVERAPLDFAIAGQQARFEMNDDGTGLWLDPAEAEQGHFQGQITRANLETMLLNGGQDEVGKHGLKVEKVELTLQDRGPRHAHAEARVTAATKMAFATIRAVVRGQGEVIIDDQLNLAIRGLAFSGEGITGKMAAGLAKQMLHQFDGWTYPLASLSLGRLRLREVHLACRDGIQVEGRVAADPLPG